MSFRKTHKNIISLFMVMLLVLSNFNLAFKNKVFAQTGPELLITEIMVRAQSGTDPYEFIEVYNNTNVPIDIKDYKFNYPSSDIDVSKIIQPKEVLVICSTSTTTLADFNAFYGTNLTEDQFVNFKITAGISNTPPKTIVLAKDTGEEVCRATYNSGDFDIKLSTTYKYPETGIDMILLGQKQQPTPGFVFPNQVPLDQNSDIQAPTITHTPITEADNTNDLIISANITDDVQISNAKVYYRKVGDTAYKSISMQKNNDLYTAVIPKSELSTQGIEYYIEASDGINTVTYPSDINNPLKVVIKEVDNVQPKVFIISPQSGEWIENKRPQISATIEDSSGLDLTTLKIYIDNVDVTDKTNLTYKDVEPKKFIKLEYNPAEDLAEGEHVVRIFIRDLSSLKNAADFTWNFYIGQETYNLYFGQIHAHTNYSDGLGTPEEAYDYAKNVAKADFFAITDHSNSFDNDTQATILDGSASSEWRQLHQIADQYNEDGKFVAIAAYEMTWSGSTGGWGHINTFNTPGFLSRNSRINNKAVDLKMYYDELKKVPQSISQFNHPGPTYGDFADFGYYDPDIDKLITLIEVGNGEGAVRSSGYFPSYEFYTRALDKGWHLAPTNNQDNHKGNWILANTARTVALAKNLTRDDIYDAFRNMRVYATEDNNLRIVYKVNNKYMGTILNNPDKLNFNISIQDPDLNDKIGKVSIIANGGIVVTSKYFDSNTAEWNFTLNPKYSYYYVRVDQEDLDIAVTAPVWTSDVVPVGLSSVKSNLKLAETNKPVTIDAVVYNNSTTSISNVKVEFYRDEIKDENKIDERIITNLNAGSTGLASINWTSSQEGKYTIYAKATINYGGVDKTFTSSTVVEFIAPENAVKVVIDAGHYNQYVSGDYKGKVTKFKSMLEDRKVIVYEDYDGLTDSDLEGVRLLVLTDPQSKDNASYNLYKSNYTDAEIEVIKRFVQNGGSVIITSRADYNDIGVTDPSYQNANQGNRVLEAIGSNLRFNDDEVIDNVNNNGQNYRLLFNRYVSDKFNLTKNVSQDQLYSFFSGCSVIPKDNADLTNVDFVVKGHDTTEILDSDKQNDAKPVQKGEVYVLAVEKLNSGAKLIVAGSTFFSDFEMTGDNQYANVPITENILDWILAGEKVITPILEVRKDINNDNIPDNLGKIFTVEGYVTAESASMGNRHSFFDVIYVQDETGGITVFGVSTRQIPLGVKVRVTGKVDQYMGDTELQISNELKDIEIIDPNPINVEPKLMSTKEAMLEENEGWLVKVEGTVTRIVGQNIFLDDGSGEARVYVEGYIAGDVGSEAGKWDERIKIGSKISAVGLASEDAEGHRIRVRNTAEIVLIEMPENESFEIISIEKPEKVIQGQDIKVTIKAINRTKNTKDATLIVALYDDDNRFIIYGAAKQSVESNKDAILTVMMKIPANQRNLRIRYFVWDSIENMMPLSNMYEIAE